MTPERSTTDPDLPAAVAARVDVWIIRLDATADLERARTALSPEETARAHGYADEKLRRRFVIARGASRRLLAAYSGTSPHTLLWRTGLHGKPSLGGAGDTVRFNLSHCADLALLAVTDTRDVGVDVEAPNALSGAPAFARRFFPPHEASLLAAAPPPMRPVIRALLWTRKEACVKAAGGKLVEGLGIPVALHGDPFTTADPLGHLPGEWTVTGLEPTESHVAAVALASREPYSVVMRPYQWG